MNEIFKYINKQYLKNYLSALQLRNIFSVNCEKNTLLSSSEIKNFRTSLLLLFPNVKITKRSKLEPM